MEANIKNKKTKEVKTKPVVAEGITITESLSSTKLTRTAGGEVRPEVKVYHQDPLEACKIARKIMDGLNEHYKVNQ